MPLNDSIVEKVLESIEPDIKACFSEMFEPLAFVPDLEGSGLPPERTRAMSDVLVAVPWALRCRHTGVFLGVPPTNLEIELRGTTIVRAPDDDSQNQAAWIYYRYIDYLGALQQLGVTTATRPAFDTEQAKEYIAWKKSGS